MGELEHIQTASGKSWVTLWQAATSWQSNIESKQPFTLSLTPKVNLESPIPKMQVFGVWERARVPTQKMGEHENYTKKK